MILVVGGLGAGKIPYVTEVLGYGADELSSVLDDDKPVLINLHELIRTSGSLDSTETAALLAKEVIVCNEVGSGVVPLEASERAWRDEVGRISALVAKEAETVVRMVCGLPHVIKGTLL